MHRAQPLWRNADGAALGLDIGPPDHTVGPLARQLDLFQSRDDVGLWRTRRIGRSLSRYSVAHRAML